MPRVTVIVATYERPALLARCLAAVRAQTASDWEALVVGDRCGPGTAEAVAAQGDGRIRFVNLPRRCGEQALPNSVGLQLARSPAVAFLNHDDWWLPDHLERGLAALDGAEICTTGAAFAQWAPPPGPGVASGVAIVERTPEGRRLEQAFGAARFLFEPVSSWLARTEAARRVGPFRPGALTARVPVVDWLLRAWRAGLAHADEPRLTVIKNNVHQPGLAGPSYAAPSPFFDAVEAMARGRSPDEVREAIRRELDASRLAGRRARDFHDPSANDLPAAALRGRLTPEAARRFLVTGEDAYAGALEAAGRAPGWLIAGTLRHRTGEVLPEPPDLDGLVAAARAQLGS